MEYMNAVSKWRSTQCASSHQKNKVEQRNIGQTQKNTILKLSEPNKYVTLGPPLLRKLMHFFVLLHFLVLILQFFHENMSRM